jgi:hypothetical protein
MVILKCVSHIEIAKLKVFHFDSKRQLIETVRLIDKLYTFSEKPEKVKKGVKKK